MTHARPASLCSWRVCQDSWGETVDEREIGRVIPWWMRGGKRGLCVCVWSVASFNGCVVYQVGLHCTSWYTTSDSDCDSMNWVLIIGAQQRHTQTQSPFLPHNTPFTSSIQSLACRMKASVSMQRRRISRAVSFRYRSSSASLCVCRWGDARDGDETAQAHHGVVA